MLGERNGVMASHRNLPRSFAPVDSDEDEDYTDPEVSSASFMFHNAKNDVMF